MTDSTIDRFERKFVRGPTTDCWLWNAAVNKGGYGIFLFGGRNITAHRAAYKIYVALVPDDLFVCHRCDNRRCVNPNHLFLGSATENMTDRDAKGRQAKGSDFKRSKLNQAAIVEIHQSRLPDTVLARKFGVTKGAINHVRHRRNWRHIEASSDG
jgi:hypothetical protein